nr:ATP12 family protein [Liberibacter crescens]
MKYFKKRFYKDVSIRKIEDKFFIELDNEILKTPLNRDLAVFSEDLAFFIADEWRSQKDEIDLFTMPITRIVNSFLDKSEENSKEIFQDLLSLLETDMLFYRVDSPRELVERQSQRWDPLIDWMARVFGANFILSRGISYKKQPLEAINAFSGALQKYNSQIMLSCLHMMATFTNSVLVSLAVAENIISINEAWEIAYLEEDWMNDYWGYDSEAQKRREFYFREINAVFTVLSVVKITKKI